MHIYTEAQKRATYKWRAKNEEKVKEYALEYGNEYYAKNCEMVKIKRMKSYYRDRYFSYDITAKIFLKILKN